MSKDVSEITAMWQVTSQKPAILRCQCSDVFLCHTLSRTHYLYLIYSLLPWRWRHSITQSTYMSFAGFWRGEFSSRMLGLGHLISNVDISLANKTKQMPCCWHLLYRVGPYASSFNFFASQELTNGLYHYNPAEIQHMRVCVCVRAHMRACVDYNTQSSSFTDSFWHVFNRCLAWTSPGILVTKTKTLNGFPRCLQMAFIMAPWQLPCTCFQGQWMWSSYHLRLNKPLQLTKRH
jgi:hypothetical protein